MKEILEKLKRDDAKNNEEKPIIVRKNDGKSNGKKQKTQINKSSST